ncbi:MAG: 3-hydroxyisobutyrate dehydrogenase [Gammaproteobacteria bacterium]|nr:3-hydroxyisobutyrate dehydrogenase [Gammaproteobacteria bacterium]
MTKVGFAGLGNMGGPMARNLVAAGHEVRVYDLVPELARAVEGGVPVDSAAAAADGVDVFISMLPAGRHVAGLYLGDGKEGGVLERLSPEALVIDCSTIDPATARRVAAAAAEKGLDMLDAPVSGGTAGAENGTLTFIVGGPEPALKRARPLFEAMGANVFHAGGNGAGQIAKVCNNMLLAVQMAGTAEALSLGVDNGLDPAVLSEIIKRSSGGNWALNVYNPWPGVMEGVPAGRGYEGGFLVDLMTKDLGLAMEAAEQSRSSVPMGSLAKNLYRVHEQVNAAGRLDFSSIQWLYRPEMAAKRES